MKMYCTGALALFFLATAAAVRTTPQQSNLRASTPAEDGAMQEIGRNIEALKLSVEQYAQSRNKTLLTVRPPRAFAFGARTVEEKDEKEEKKDEKEEEEKKEEGKEGKKEKKEEEKEKKEEEAKKTKEEEGAAKEAAAEEKKKKKAEEKAQKAAEKERKKNSVNHRVKKAVKFAKKADPKTQTAWVKQGMDKLMQAWSQYQTKANKQPMEFECAGILQSCRTESHLNYCSFEFMEFLDLAEHAQPYCKWFDQGYDVSMADIEHQADKWCSKAECESAVEELSHVEDELMSVAEHNPRELLDAVKYNVPHFEEHWDSLGCIPKVCQTLEAQANECHAAMKVYDHLPGDHGDGPAMLLKIEQLVVYDIHKVMDCKA